MVKTESVGEVNAGRDLRRGVALLRQAGSGFGGRGGASGTGRGLRGAVLALVCCALALVIGGAARAEDLSGGYFGLGDARGMRIEVEQGDPAGDPAGLFIDSNGAEARFGGAWVGGGIEAVLAFPDSQVFLRLDAAPSGLVAIALPLDEDGQPIERASREMTFLRDGLAPPAQPELYQPEPDRADRVVDPDVFLASYSFWSPEGVSRGFSAIGARYRTMMRLYPMVHADVLWKLCGADGRLASEQRGEALRGQGVECAELLGLVEDLQRSGRFGEWKAAAEAEGADFLAAVQCARGYIVKREVCGPAAQKTAAAAVSLRTVATAIQPFR
ncbi:hypothetical protein ACQ5SO_19255 [Rhodovulum sp. DZ06]|uniref:hypothetical protein n=1 Tax=Rhodovulum sp. DZ06 TaxID=3425126 RepID=UPI003D3386F9